MTKRIKKPTPKQNRIYMVRTALALVLVALFFAMGGGIIYVKNQTTTQTFTSDFMKVQFDYPAKLYAKSDQSSVTLSNPNNGGTISVSKYGTNFRDVYSHVENSIGRWKDKPTSIDSFVGDLEKGVVVNGESKHEQYRVYYFVKDYAVYQFEANDPALFSDLDAIAKSFRILQ